MTVYIILLIYMSVSLLFFRQYKNNVSDIYGRMNIIFISIWLFLIMALRGVHVGTDLTSYFSEYKQALFGNLLRPNEIGFSYFNYIVSSLGFNFNWFLAFNALIVMVCVLTFYFRYSRNILMSIYLHVTIGFFAMSMSGLRQTLAISISLFAFRFLMDNKILKFLVTVLIAFSFHNSALVLVLLLAIKKIKLTRMKAIIAFSSSFIIIIFMDSIVAMIKFLSPYKYMPYFDVEAVNYINPIVIITLLAIPVACLIFWPDMDGEDDSYVKIYSAMFMLSCANVLVYIIAGKIEFFARLSLYLIVFNTVLIPNTIEAIKGKNARFAARLLAIIFPFLQFIISIPDNSIGIDHYKFFWD